MKAVARRPLLVELLVEELPPKALKRLGESFASGIAQGLRTRGLIDEAAAVTGYATPRRLAVHVADVADVGADVERDEKLMTTNVALGADGELSDAARRRLAKLGREALAMHWRATERGADDQGERLYVAHDGKADALFLKSVVPGSALGPALEAVLQETIAALPIPKVMTYQLADGWTSVKFVRPAHGLVALHGADVVPVEVLGLRAGRATRGHRFEAAQPVLELRDADSYNWQLNDEGAVIASFEARRDAIRRQLFAASARETLRPIDDDDLLDEVTALVEQPNVVLCRFEPEFLAVPPECLVLTMKANQKYFPLLDGEGRLTNRFLVVSNVRPADTHRVVEGNERVVRPRLADAKFFYDQDRRTPLAARVPRLDQVVYHGKLGSQGDRVRRLRAIVAAIAKRIGSDPVRCDRAAELCKADLLTEMVGEFPELQGIMGAYYALHDGEPADVASAIRDQYRYRRDDDARNDVNLTAETLAMADRAEALVGLWGVGGKPTGEKDPYALRRAALALIGAFTLVGSARPLDLSLHELLSVAAATFPEGVLAPDTIPQVEAFVYDRYAHQLAAQPAYDGQTVQAVIAQRPPLHDIVKRLDAVLDFRRLDEAQALAAANKRVGNILKKSPIGGASGRVDAALLREHGEIALHGALADVQPRAEARYASGDYAAALKELAALRAPVDAFFDSVMVNADDPALRANRLALLAGLHAAMNRVADLSKLAA
ncbi:MAG TPA: glycine--tRNA ligase subunit beta [Caldimonas sp.]|nr:glycine--tRNA ligase subunit beta [Caldimonas sp.]